MRDEFCAERHSYKPLARLRHRLCHIESVGQDPEASSAFCFEILKLGSTIPTKMKSKKKSRKNGHATSGRVRVCDSEIGTVLVTEQYPAILILRISKLLS